MKVKVDFNNLANVLGYANTVLNDKSVNEKQKNFIFMKYQGEVHVVAFSPSIFSRVELEGWEEEEESDDDWSFQVKASELNKIMSSFSSLYKTHVSEMKFYEEGTRIGVEIYEEPNEETDQHLKQKSDFYLENAPIIGKTLDEIKTSFPSEGVDSLDGSELGLYLETLFPIMNNDTSSSTASKLNFAEDYVFVITSSNTGFMPNKLPTALKDLTLTYSSASFLKKICTASEGGVEIAKTEKYLCVKTGTISAFMRYQKIKVNYKMYVDRRSKDLGFVVDRMYLKDVLKRMGNFALNGKITVLDGESIQVENDSFQQVIPLNKSKGDVAGIKFNISVNILEKVILGMDDVFSGDLFIYLVPIQRGYIIYLSDSTGAWFSNMQCTK